MRLVDGGARVRLFALLRKVEEMRRRSDKTARCGEKRLKGGRRGRDEGERGLLRALSPGISAGLMSPN